MSEYKNIKVKPATFMRLRSGKDDGQSWDHYLNEIADEAGVPEDE